MAVQHTITFNVCPDNGKAAAEFIKRAKASGARAELVQHDEATAKALAAHNDDHGNAPPAAVAHDMDPADALAIAVDVESAFATRGRSPATGNQSGRP